MIDIAKGTLLVDIDGTIIHSETEEPLKGAVRILNKAQEDGYILILTTMRGHNWPIGHRYSVPSTLRLLKTIGLRYADIQWDCPSPRTVINDEGAASVHHPRDEEWKEL